MYVPNVNMIHYGKATWEARYQCDARHESCGPNDDVSVDRNLCNIKICSYFGL
jgi:hypothetical protein